jgi:solute carrier family 35 protein F5
MGVIMAVTGSILTAWHDARLSSDDDAVATMANVTNVGMPHQVDQADAWEGHAMLGDVLGLLSAVGYGAYAVMIRVMCPHDERCMSMQLLLGYMGLFNACALSPIAIYLILWPSAASDGDDTTGMTVQGTLTWVIFGYLVAKGMLDDVVSEYLWARAVVLTSATVATVGLGLTIPLAFVSDWVMGHGNVVSLQSVLGALSVLVGFILVNIGNKQEEAHDDGQIDEIATEVLE